MDVTTLAAVTSLDSDAALSNTAHCGRDALTNSYGWFIQVLLASLAFMLLIGKLEMQLS